MLGSKMPKLPSVLLLALCFAVSIKAQVNLPPGATDTDFGGGNAITGMILVSTGQRLERRVSVRLVTMTKGERVAMSDESGKFAFQGLSPGDYTITIEKEKDFQPFSQAVSIIQPRGSPPQTYALNIRLNPIPGTDLKPGVINSEFAGVPAKALDLYKKAIELANAGDHKGAIVQFDLAITEYPKFSLAYNDMGVQYLKLNDLVRADDAFKSALNVDPTSFAPLLNHGLTIFDLKIYREAEVVFRKVVKAKDGFAVGHFFLGKTLANLGKFEEADKELTAGMTLGGEAMADSMKEGHRILAIICAALGNKKRAANELETYLRLAPNAPDAEQLRSTIQKLRGT